MKDRYGREIDYLRVSITDRCNLRCKYCMPHDIEPVGMKDILSYEEIIEIAGQAALLGINRIKITGGEPLIRRGCTKLIRKLKSIPGIEQVTITTNGVLLKENLNELLKAGIDGINISIDTLDPLRYRLITGDDKLDHVLEGLYEVLNSGIIVKINAVSVDWTRVFQNFSLDAGDYDASGIIDADPYRDAFELIDLAHKNAVDVRFIEMMPIGFGRSFPAIAHDVLIPAIKSRYKSMISDNVKHGNGPSVYYNIPGYKGSIGFISAIHGPFCNRCNRIRLTTLGYLKSCLCFDQGVDLKGILRSSLSGEEIRSKVRSEISEAILCKPYSHLFDDEKKISENHIMSEIGG